MKHAFLLRISLGLLALISNSHAQADTGLTSMQQQQVQTIVHDYLLNNPQVLLESMQALQQKTRNELQQRAQKVIVAQASALFDAPGSPVLGNLHGSINVIEFFDYQCGYCKRMAIAFNELSKLNPQVRLIYKQLPIFGADSTFAAQAALAAQFQNKFLPLHNALMAAKAPLTAQNVLQMARAVNLDIAKLQADMQKPTLINELKNNIALANQLQLSGTPALILARVEIKNGAVGVPRGSLFLPGAVSAAQLKQAIQQLASI